MAKPIMAKATAVWLVDHTPISFKQIADFVGMHELEVQGIADGDVAQGVKGFDPVANNQLTQEEIDAAQDNPLHKLKLKFNAAAEGEEKRRGPRYTPLSKRQDRPASILWLVKFHPELSDGQVSKLVGTTKPTIQAIRERTHWNIANIQPIDPVALGLCKQSELDAAVQKAAYDGQNKTDPLTLVRNRGTRLLTADFQAGDLVVFSGFTMHGSLDNHSPSGRVRLSVDVRFQPAADPADDERYFGTHPTGSNGGGYGDMRGAKPLRE